MFQTAYKVPGPLRVECLLEFLKFRIDKGLFWVRIQASDHAMFFSVIRMKMTITSKCQKEVKSFPSFQKGLYPFGRRRKMDFESVHAPFHITRNESFEFLEISKCMIRMCNRENGIIFPCKLPAELYRRLISRKIINRPQMCKVPGFRECSLDKRVFIKCTSHEVSYDFMVARILEEIFSQVSIIEVRETCTKRLPVGEECIFFNHKTRLKELIQLE